MNIAVIPARGGSKRIPRKNIKLFAGKPMLSYAVTVAQKSQLFDDIIVSSDDSEILELATQLGATPLQRPVELADDMIPTIPVIQHAITTFETTHQSPECVCCIYPAVPFLQAQTLKESLLMFNQQSSDYVFPIVAFTTPIQRALVLNDEGKLMPFRAYDTQARTQDMTTTYHDAGQFYWGKTSAWLQNKPIHDNATGFVLPVWAVIDIDTPDDWRRAELMQQLCQT